MEVGEHRENIHESGAFFQNHDKIQTRVCACNSEGDPSAQLGCRVESPLRIARKQTLLPNILSYSQRVQENRRGEPCGLRGRASVSAI